ELEKAGIKATTLLLEGDPAQAISDAAEKEDASLIMMGSTGKSVTEEMLIGSVSEHVALTANRSVLLVH
ncbi:MAG: universal stress protein, partial [Gemmatimonadota bacterium]